MTNGSLTFWIVIAAASAAFGALYGFLFHEGPGVLGVTYGTCIGVLAIAYERGALFPRYTTCLRRLPSLAYFAAAEISLLLVIVVGMSATGLVVRALGLTDKSLAELVTPQPQAVLYAMAVSALLIGVLRVREPYSAWAGIPIVLLIIGWTQRTACSRCPSHPPHPAEGSGRSQMQKRRSLRPAV